MTRTARTYSALAAVVVAFAALAALLFPGTASAGTGVSSTIAIFQAAAPNGEHLTHAQANAAMQSADRVCEGYKSRVPFSALAHQVQRESGLNWKQSKHFVVVAHRELCPSF